MIPAKKGKEPFPEQSSRLMIMVVFIITAEKKIIQADGLPKLVDEFKENATAAIRGRQIL